MKEKLVILWVSQDIDAQIRHLGHGISRSISPIEEVTFFLL